ncbi:MAG: CDP-alcohol phosphatidyltransferase family protein [Candidatus Latescibacterota bacterium]|nr:MAG: CDP-alcohol phosphatidyltransferase family protein [Candidatus Latescibacterota bacterium]
MKPHVRLPDHALFTIPNSITVLRMFMTLAACALFVSHRLEIVGVLLLATAVVLDGLDGWFARRLFQCSKLGTFMDPLADKVNAAVLFGIIAVKMDSPAIWLLFGIVVFRDLVVTALRCVYLARLGAPIPADHLGKIKTFFQGATGIAIVAYGVVVRGDFGFSRHPVIGVLAVIVVLSVVSGARFLRLRPASVRGNRDRSGMRSNDKCVSVGEKGDPVVAKGAARQQRGLSPTRTDPL